MRHLRLLARSAVVSVVLAVPACGGDAETDLFGPGTGGTGALGGAAGSAIAGSGGTAGLAGAAGSGAKAGQAGASGAGAKAGAGGSNAGAGGAAGKAGQGGAAGKAGQGGEAGASGGQAGAGQAGAAQGGEAGASGLGGATAGGASGGGGAIGGGAGEAGAAGQATGGGGQGGSGGAGIGGASGGAGLGGSGGGATCGNGVLDASEKCDGDLFGGVTCESLLGPGTVGKLACRPDCSFDASGCGLCGNGKIDPGEECEDGPDVASGRCDATCRIKCPDGGKAFAGHCYARYTDFKNWDAARKTCSDKQGHLVSIGSAEENAFVDNQLIGGSVIDVWIGYSDGGLEGSFVWVDGTSTAYTNWTNNEPNDFFNAEDCALLNPSNGKWSDLGCGTFHHFVCEIDEPLKK